MKIFFQTIVLIILASHHISSQDCFMPPNGDTLYTTTNSNYNPPSITGFITLGNNLSGSWSQSSSTGTANVMFSDANGRTSTLSITGTGTVTIDNTVTDINTNAMTSCQQTFEVHNYVPSVVPNPTLPANCPINLVIVIDESESISDNMSSQTIRDAVYALADGLANTGSKLAIVEFDTEAERIPLLGSTLLQEIDAALLISLTNYLNNDYDPIGNPAFLIGGTNWEDALDKANEVDETDLVLMITDGRPTYYSTSMGMNGVAGEGDIFDLTALKQAMDAANRLKNSGKRLFVAGLDFPSEIQPIRDISGNTEYFLGQNIIQLFNADFTLVSPSALVPLFEQLGASCVTEIIPTLGEWSILNLTLLLLIFGVVGIRSNQYVKNT